MREGLEHRSQKPTHSEEDRPETRRAPLMGLGAEVLEVFFSTASVRQSQGSLFLRAIQWSFCAFGVHPLPPRAGVCPRSQSMRVALSFAGRRVGWANRSFRGLSFQHGQATYLPTYLLHIGMAAFTGKSLYGCGNHVHSEFFCDSGRGISAPLFLFSFVGSWGLRRQAPSRNSRAQSCAVRSSKDGRSQAKLGFISFASVSLGHVGRRHPRELSLSLSLSLLPTASHSIGLIHLHHLLLHHLLLVPAGCARTDKPPETSKFIEAIPAVTSL